MEEELNLMLSRMKFLGDAWSLVGGRTLIDRAGDRFRELLAGAGQPEIPSGRIEEMEHVVAEADRALAQ
jgi:trimethylamine:corrinoid methyltransferase-like protein